MKHTHATVSAGPPLVVTVYQGTISSTAYTLDSFQRLEAFLKLPAAAALTDVQCQQIMTHTKAFPKAVARMRLGKT